MMLHFVEAEMQLLEYRINNPKIFASLKQHTEQLCWSKEFDAVDLMELITALEASGAVVDSDKKAVSFNRLSELFGYIFSVEFADCYKKRDAVLSRKNKQTKFLDKLKDALIKKSLIK